MSKKIKVTVVGSGYVGMSLAVLLAQYNDVTVLDINPERVDQVNRKEATVADPEIELFLRNRELSLKATLDKQVAYANANFVVVATPTNYDPEMNKFDTSSVDAVVHDALALTSGALILIKSTVPVGHTCSLQELHNTDRVVFSPEFLREGRALRDNLYPSRIVMGCSAELGEGFANLLQQAAEKADVETLFMRAQDAEAVKLFANTYLAMRVAFFNELDSYALVTELDTQSIISGVCLDERIGGGYNNPSFGYGGYCLPKDTKQLLANYNEVPQKLIKAIVTSNSTRQDFIADAIVKLKPQVVGVYRLAMKQGSDNFRVSAVLGVIERLRALGIEVVIYEPSFSKESFINCRVFVSLSEFKATADIIISNRLHEDLNDVPDKIFSRDLYGCD